MYPYTPNNDHHVPAVAQDDIPVRPENEGQSGSSRSLLSSLWLRVSTRVNIGVMVAYSGAAALIGIEGLAVVVTYSSMWPVGIPIVVGVLWLAYVFRERSTAAWRRFRGRGPIRTDEIDPKS